MGLVAGLTNVAAPAGEPDYNQHRIDGEFVNCGNPVWWVSTNPVWRHLDSLSEECAA